MVHVLGCGWRDTASPAAPTARRRPRDGAAVSGQRGGRGLGRVGRRDCPYDRAARFGLPVFHAARTAAVQLIRLGYQRATTSDARVMLAGHRKALEDASAELPPGWTDDATRSATT